MYDKIFPSKLQMILIQNRITEHIAARDRVLSLACLVHHESDHI